MKVHRGLQVELHHNLEDMVQVIQEFPLLTVYRIVRLALHQER